MFFNNRKKVKRTEEQIEKKQISAGDLYLSYVDEYIKYQAAYRDIENPLEDKEFYQKHATPFYNSAMYFVNYLESNISEEELSLENPIEFDFKKMVDGADNETKRLFNSPKYPALIYINDAKYFTHFHTDGEFIYETESIQDLPGLNRALATERINKIFNGLTPIEVRALLQQMGIYPRNTELDKTIKAVHEGKHITDIFLKAVVCLLLLKNNKYSLKRARFFADSLGIYFDFAPFEKEEKNMLKKEL